MVMRPLAWPACYMYMAFTKHSGSIRDQCSIKARHGNCKIDQSPGSSWPQMSLSSPCEKLRIRDWKKLKRHFSVKDPGIILGVNGTQVPSLLGANPLCRLLLQKSAVNVFGFLCKFSVLLIQATCATFRALLSPIVKGLHWVSKYISHFKTIVTPLFVFTNAAANCNINFIPQLNHDNATSNTDVTADTELNTIKAHNSSISLPSHRQKLQHCVPLCQWAYNH